MENKEEVVKQELPKKKRPGRPRKNPPRQPKPRNGVVENPHSSDNFMEFLYDKPTQFKKIWAFFKMMAVEHIHMLLTPDSIKIWCVDHNKKNEIRVKIDCNKVNHYYCQEELDIYLTSKDVEWIMSTIDKTYNSILLLSEKNDTQKNLKIILNNDYEAQESHVIELSKNDGIIENDHKFLDNNYMVKFNMMGKYYKKMISDLKAITNILTIRQDSFDDDLMFEYTSNTKKINSTIICNKDKFKVVSQVDENSTFRTSFNIDHVKPISSSLLAENIDIYADEVKPLMTIIHMDNKTIEFRILTEIIDERNI